MELEVAEVYGKALYELATEIDAVQDIQEEIKQINDIFRTEKEYFTLLTDPVISHAQKKELISSVFEGRVTTEVLSFLKVLADKGRVFWFEAIVKEYNRLENEARGETDGVVFSAYPLDDCQMTKITAETGRLLGKNIVLTNEIDESLLGGIKIVADDKLIDASLRSRLEALSRTIRN